MTSEYSIKSSGSDSTLARALLNAMKAAATATTTTTITKLKVAENDVALHEEIQKLAQPPRRSFLPKGFANTVQR